MLASKLIEELVVVHIVEVALDVQSQCGSHQPVLPGSVYVMHITDGCIGGVACWHRSKLVCRNQIVLDCKVLQPFGLNVLQSFAKAHQQLNEPPGARQAVGRLARLP